MIPIIIRNIVVIEALALWLRLSSEKSHPWQQGGANESPNLILPNLVVAHEITRAINVLLDFVWLQAAQFYQQQLALISNSSDRWVWRKFGEIHCLQNI